MLNRRYHKLLILSIGLILLAIVLFAIRVMSPTTIDANGYLHEPFYLVGLGYFSGISGLLVLIIRFVLDHFHH
ncbi:DUF3955 domain-containing protein [Secundilactobacillus kimchicus]|uniref:DUF3955 domain-containing protein n=1 Tax=Secundilactobacillus kimchicus TaxID=528209 RepID=UPI0006D2725D|nr:DUF3955 domain-containing protein [Secundilactobacillus kimchicus]MBT9671374.1 DUF3955 domain-containing protein [Secundilactobacillus kimchicus]